MSAIYAKGDLITRLIKVVPQASQKRIVTTLLDGTDHVQTVGEEVTRIEVELFADVNCRDVIDEIDRSGELIQVLDEEGNLHDGRVINKGMWEKLAKGFYKTTIIISVEVI